MDPKHTALISIDMHRGHLDPAVATMPLEAGRAAAVIERAAAAFELARAAGIPIVHVVTIYRSPSESQSNPFWNSRRSATRARAAEHNLAGSPGTEIVGSLYRPGDIVVNDKKRYSAFLHTNLEFVLRDLDVKTVLLAGVNTNSCLLCSAFEAVNRDFETIMLEDCVDSMDGEDAHRKGLELFRVCLGATMTNAALAAALAKETVVA